VPVGGVFVRDRKLGVETGRAAVHVYALAVGASLLTALVRPGLTRQGEARARGWEMRPMGRLRQWVTFYHGWLVAVAHAADGQPARRQARPRLLQVALHICWCRDGVVANPLYQKGKAVLGAGVARSGAMLFVVCWTASGLVCWCR